MPLFDKPILQLSEDDLLVLIVNQESEGKTLDYKRDTVGASDVDRKEFLNDASSFANTNGGYLIFGMDEAQGLPTNLPGLSGIDPDKEILRLEQMVRHGIRPVISVETTAIKLNNGNVAIVMRIARSWNPPHQVTFQNSFRFYARDSRGKYQLDVDELRTIFSSSTEVAQRIRDFKVDRIAKITAGEAPVPLLNKGTLALHLVPFSAFASGTGFRFEEAAQSPRKFPPFGNNAPLDRVTFDGLLTTSNMEPPPKPQRAYTQVFRTGAIEAVESTIGGDSGWIELPKAQAMIIAYADRYVRALYEFGLDAPVAVLVSLLGVQGKRLLTDFAQRGAFREDLPSETLAHAQYHFTESILDIVPSGYKEAAKSLRGTLDHMANAAGLAASPYFDVNGDYTLNI